MASDRPGSDVVPSGFAGASKAERVREMFTRIVPHYDRMNLLMTGGLDRHWRRVAADAAAPAGQDVLDVGCGTGDLAIALARRGVRRVVGVDFSPGMLAAAGEKIRRLGPSGRVFLVEGDALALPFPDASFDRVTSGFLLRNLADLALALTEMRRVLRPGGRVICLEITHPPPAVAPLLHLYFDRAIPLLGALVAREPAAYRYLPASLGPLPAADALADLLRGAGFRDVGYRRLGFGLVALHEGRR